MLKLISDDCNEFIATEQNASEVFEAFHKWQEAERGSAEECHLWQSLLDVASDYICKEFKEYDVVIDVTPN